MCTPKTGGADESHWENTANRKTEVSQLETEVCSSEMELRILRLAS